MIRSLVMLAALLPGVAVGAECTLENARYNQPGSGWTLTFEPIPKGFAANQMAAFTIEMPASELKLTGGIWVPNGFGSPLYRVEGRCSPASKNLCGFIEDEAVAVYGNTDEGIVMLDVEAGGTGAAPQQILLPELSVSLWYSMYRGNEFTEELDPTDVFTLVGCD